MEEKIELLVAWMNRGRNGFRMMEKMQTLMAIGYQAYANSIDSGYPEDMAITASDRAVVEHILKSDQP